MQGDDGGRDLQAAGDEPDDDSEEELGPLAKRRLRERQELEETIERAKVRAQNRLLSRQREAAAADQEEELGPLAKRRLRERREFDEACEQRSLRNSLEVDEICERLSARFGQMLEQLKTIQADQRRRRDAAEICKRRKAAWAAAEALRDRQAPRVDENPQGGTTMLARSSRATTTQQHGGGGPFAAAPSSLDDGAGGSSSDGAGASSSSSVAPAAQPQPQTTALDDPSSSSSSSSSSCFQLPPEVLPAMRAAAVWSTMDFWSSPLGTSFPEGDCDDFDPVAARRTREAELMEQLGFHRAFDPDYYEALDRAAAASASSPSLTTAEQTSSSAPEQESSGAGGRPMSSGSAGLDAVASQRSSRLPPPLSTTKKPTTVATPMLNALASHFPPAGRSRGDSVEDPEVMDSIFEIALRTVVRDRARREGRVVDRAELREWLAKQARLRHWMDAAALDPAAAAGLDSEWQCPICFDSNRKEELVAMCRDEDGRPMHTFHSSCATNWLDHKNECPACRRSPIVETED